MSLFFACTKNEEVVPQFTLKTSDLLDDVDYQIYSLGITDPQANTKQPVVLQTSSKGKSISEEIGSDSYVKLLKSEIPDLDATVFTDFKTKNASTVNFDNKFSMSSKTVKLIGQEELNFVFSVSDINGSWENFYKTYPNSNGYINFSRIGYNTTKTQAVLEIGNFYASLGADGAIVFLQKKNAVWKIVKIQMTWVS
jgi:hypothetical protein